MDFLKLIAKHQGWRQNGEPMKEYYTIAPTLRSQPGDTEPLAVFGQTNGTSTQQASTENTTEKSMKATSEMFPQMKSRTTIYSRLDSLVRRLASREKGLDSRTLEGLSFLKSLGFSETSDPHIFSWRMSRVCLVTNLAKLSTQSLGFLPTWGIELNGWYLTASTLEFPKTGKGCSLSDILEENVDEKYFLSEEAVRGIIKRAGK